MKNGAIVDIFKKMLQTPPKRLYIPYINCFIYSDVSSIFIGFRTSLIIANSVPIIKSNFEIILSNNSNSQYTMFIFSHKMFTTIVRSSHRPIAITNDRSLPDSPSLRSHISTKPQRKCNGLPFHLPKPLKAHSPSLLSSNFLIIFRTFRNVANSSTRYEVRQRRDLSLRKAFFRLQTLVSQSL